MKNTIVIDIDTERKQPIVIGKPATIPKPNNEEEAKKMVLEDISCTCEALCTLIHIAEQNKYSNKEDLIKTSIKYLSDMLA